jgi:hypothetical protein
MLEIQGASKSAILAELERASMAEGYSRPVSISVHNSLEDEFHFTMNSGTSELYLYVGQRKDQFGISLNVQDDGDVSRACEDLRKIYGRLAVRFPQSWRFLDDARCAAAKG